MNAAFKMSRAEVERRRALPEVATTIIGGHVNTWITRTGIYAGIVPENWWQERCR